MHTINKQKFGKPLSLCLLALALATGCAGGDDAIVTDTATGDTLAVTETEAATTETVSETEKETETEAVTTDIFEDEKGKEEDALAVQPLFRDDYVVNMAADNNHARIALDKIVEGLIMKNEGVYVGKDGWMFYFDCIEDFEGTNTYTDGMLARIAKQLQTRADWCEENGMEFYFMIAPNKSTIYPEMMTDKVTEGELHRIDQVYTYLAENTTVKCIDVCDRLLEAKEERPTEDLYYRLDTHWNSHGGFCAYQATMDMLEKDFSGIKRLTRNDYQIDIFDSYFKDCAWYLGYYDTMKSEGPVYTKKDGKKGAVSSHDGSGEWGQFANGYIDPGTGFHHASYYYETVSRYAAADGQPSLYIVRDSFYIPMDTFFRDTFSKVTSCWTTDFPNDDILSKKPDIVIFECVEAKMQDTFSQKALRKG